MKKLFRALILAVALTLCLGITAFAQDTVPEIYEESETAYTVYTDAQYQEVLNGIKDGTLLNKTVVLGCDIETKFDFVMDVEMDITIDLNNFCLNNTYKSSNKWGDFDFQNENAILRIKNGKMTSTFCVFVFRTNGQVYGENLDIVSNEECFYQYGGHGGVVSLKNCNIDVIGDYTAVSLGGNCNNKGGTLYQIEGGRFDGLNLFCSLPGSYVRNCTVYARELFIDSWHSHGKDGGDVEIELTNVVSEVRIRLNDPRIDPVLYDCTTPTITMSGDKQLIVSYTSPTCTSAGTKASYTGTESTVTFDEQYSIDNPALPHSASNTDCTKDVLCEMCNEAVVYAKQYDEHDTYAVAIAYKNGFASAGEQTLNCKNCNAVSDVEQVLAIFVPQGYTSNADSTGFGTGFQINKDALAAYESINNTEITFGIVVFNPNYLNADTFFTNGKMNVSKGALQVNMSTDYSNCNLLIKGFTAEHSSLELVFAGYAYEGTDTSELQIMQKDYLETDASPMQSKVEKEAILYTVKLSTIVNPTVVGSKENLDNYLA